MFFGDLFKCDGERLKCDGERMFFGDLFKCDGRTMRTPQPTMRLIADEKIKIDMQYIKNLAQGLSTRNLGKGAFLLVGRQALILPVGER